MKLGMKSNVLVPLHRDRGRNMPQAATSSPVDLLWV